MAESVFERAMVMLETQALVLSDQHLTPKRARVYPEFGQGEEGDLQLSAVYLRCGPVVLIFDETFKPGQVLLEYDYSKAEPCGDD